MKRLFILYYIGVLIVLAAAWYVHGSASRNLLAEAGARNARLAEGGGVRLAVEELRGAADAERTDVLNRLEREFQYPVAIVPRDDLPAWLSRRLRGDADFAFWRRTEGDLNLAAAGPADDEATVFGPLPEYPHIESRLAGGVRLIVARLDAAPPNERAATLEKLQASFSVPIAVVESNELPPRERRRLAQGADVVFYEINDQNLFYIASPLSKGNQSVRFGPYPTTKAVEQQVLAISLAATLVLAAIAIALFLIPVAVPLRLVERAAKAISSGDLAARVDERRAASAKPLARAFNEMADRVEAMLRTQRELLQAVSHELRTPLARIRFATQLALEADREEERADRLESIDAACDELDSLVGELLVYVRMETNESTVHPEEIDVAAVGRELLEQHAVLHPEIAFSVDDKTVDESPTVFADRASLQRVLGNLASNAAKFADRRVELSARTTPAATIIDVVDDGPGIPPHDRTRVFEPFVRLGDGPSSAGVGLGLALVRRIMIRHGGVVQILGDSGGGCTVRTLWPHAATPGREYVNLDEPTLIPSDERATAP